MQAYVLSLPRLENRREHMKEQLAKFDIKANWIDAVDREEFRGFPDDYNSALSHEWLGRDMGLGEIACLMSHLKAYQALIQSGDDWAIILEDDIVLYGHPEDMLCKLPMVDGNKLVLGTSTQTTRRRIRQSFGLLHDLEALPYGAYCYAINRTFAAQAIVHLRQTLHLPIDVYFRHAGAGNQGGFWQLEGLADEGAIGNDSAIGDEARMHDRHPSAWRPFASSNECPKLIHQIWIGPDAPWEYITTWRKKNPRRIHKCWKDEELREITSDYDVGEIYASYVSKGLLPAAADVARYCLLHRFGGFYADADSLARRELDINTPFLVHESETYRPDLLCNGFIQSKARCPVITDCLEKIREMKHPVDEGRVWDHLGPGLLTKVASSHAIEKLPSGLFLPDHYLGKNPPCPDPYCDHEWSSTFK